MILALLLACTGAGSDSAVSFPGDDDYERDPALDVELQSVAGGTASHNTGEACMHCHQAHSNGRGQFTAAGSAYRDDGSPASQGSIQLYVGSLNGGELAIELPVDALGNFYTTVDLGLPDAPVVPAVVDATGSIVNSMPWPTESASCNQCHTPAVRVLMP